MRSHVLEDGIPPTSMVHAQIEGLAEELADLPVAAASGPSADEVPTSSAECDVEMQNSEANEEDLVEVEDPAELFPTEGTANAESHVEDGGILDVEDGEILDVQDGEIDLDEL